MKTKVEFQGIEYSVEYSYTPEEKGVRYRPDGGGTPDIPAYVEIHKIMLGEHDMTGLFGFFSDPDGIGEIEKMVLIQHEGGKK